MKIHIWTRGDLSVGICGDAAEVEINSSADLGYDERDERDLIRTALNTAFTTIFGGEKVYVVFQDELDAPNTSEHDENIVRDLIFNTNTDGHDI